MKLDFHSTDGYLTGKLRKEGSKDSSRTSKVQCEQIGIASWQVQSCTGLLAPLPRTSINCWASTEGLVLESIVGS